MKKNFIYALLGAIALTGAASLTACSSSDEIVDNPNYNPETNTVKTEFTISLPNYVGNSSTRQSAGIVQFGTTPTFRGIENPVLIGYASKVTEGTALPFNDGSVHSLPSIESFDKTDQNAKVYTNLSVPVGTGAFMFYGKAKEETPTYPADVTTDDQKNAYKKFHNGVLNGPTSFAGAASTFNFSLERIYDGTGMNTASNVKGTEILNYLKGIRAAVSSVANANLHAYLTNFKPIAGSSASVQAAVQKLWTVAKDITDAAGTTAIKNAITGSDQKVYATIANDGTVTLTHDNLLGYPANLNLPDGAAAIDWSDVANPKWAMMAFNSTNIPTLEKYVYPAALYYRANTPIGISDTEKRSESYSTYKWTEDGLRNLYDWNQTVKASTRSIALENQIQYAVGRLDLTIKSGAATLYDAKGTAVTVHQDGFPVSAVLIGGQNSVGYDFTPNGSDGYTIYDKIMTSSTMSAKNGVVSDVNHTLVLETATTTRSVYVAVELTNNTGAEFAGKDGIVPVNGKFYLIGKLDLEASGTITQPTVARDKIFEQDYITCANLTITQGTAGQDNNTGLGGAYNVIPDLRDAELELAFSVNLEWISGLTFNINI